MPPQDCDHKRGNKHPFIASELLSTECWPVLDLFFQHESLLHKLFEYLKSPEKFPILDGYFSKLASVLLSRNPSTVLAFLSANDLFSNITSSLASKSMADLLIKILLAEGQDESKKGITANLVQILSTGNETEVWHATWVVGEVIGKAAENQGAKSLCLELMAGIKVLSEGLSSGTVYSVAACAEVVKILMGSAMKDEKLKGDLEGYGFVQRIFEVLPAVVSRLRRESERFAGTDKKEILVFGTDRLKIFELLVAFARLSNGKILEEFEKNEIFRVLTEVFFTFDMNSMVHGLYEQYFSLVFEYYASDEEVLVRLVKGSGLLQKLQSGEKGFSGHVIKLASTLNKLKLRNLEFYSYLESCPEWRKFYSECYLKKTELQKRTLGEAPKIIEEHLSDERRFEEPKDSIDLLFGKIEAKDEDFDRDDEPVLDADPLEMADLTNVQEKKVDLPIFDDSHKIEKNRYSEEDEFEKENCESEIKNEDYWRF